MSEPKPTGKPFDIDKGVVWEAYRKVAANKGAPGVDEMSVAEFEQDLRNNLYKVWSASSRMGGEAVMSCSWSLCSSARRRLPV